MKTVIICFFIGVSISAIAITKTPKWISNPSKYCSQAELCAVGEGTGIMQAESAARNEISKIFMTKIRSKNTIESEGSQVSDGDAIISGSFEEEMYLEIEERTEGVLKGVIIKETFEMDDGYFALASLKKSKGASFLRTEMKNIDKRMVELYKDGSRSSLNKILKKIKIREALNLNYEFLRGGKYLSKITYKQVMKKKRVKMAQNIVIYLKVKEPGKKGEIRDILISKFLEDDFKVITNNQKHHFQVEATIKKVKEYIKVDGFEKYKFMLRINSYNKKGQKLGKLVFDTSQNGRNYTQAYNKALPLIMDFILDKIGELNID